jgi:hypothetical protein
VQVKEKMILHQQSAHPTTFESCVDTLHHAACSLGHLLHIKTLETRFLHPIFQPKAELAHSDLIKEKGIANRAFKKNYLSSTIRKHGNKQIKENTSLFVGRFFGAREKRILKLGTGKVTFRRPGEKSTVLETQVVKVPFGVLHPLCHIRISVVLFGHEKEGKPLCVADLHPFLKHVNNLAGRGKVDAVKVDPTVNAVKGIDDSMMVNGLEAVQVFGS